MTLAEAYREIESRLEALDFAALFRGFHRFPFALYNAEQAYIDGAYIEKPAGFLGNTSVQYNGAHTAIWSLPEEPGDLDVLTAKLVHEMLHAFQNASGEARWADERAALVKYRCDEANVAARLEEAACMKQCLNADAPEAFARLLSLRKARSARFPFAYDYEARIEQIEGTANFVELAALAQLSPEKAEKRWDEALAQVAEPARYFPARAVTYLTGAAFLAGLRRYTTMDTDGFTDTPFAVAALAEAEPCELPEGHPAVAACLKDWHEKAREIISRAMENADLVLEGTYRLVMWNVYDGFREGSYAILSAFLGYIEGAELPATDQELFAQIKVLNGDFVAEIDDELILTRAWRR